MLVQHYSTDLFFSNSSTLMTHIQFSVYGIYPPILTSMWLIYLHYAQQSDHFRNINFNTYILQKWAFRKLKVRQGIR